MSLSACRSEPSLVEPRRAGFQLQSHTLCYLPCRFIIAPIYREIMEHLLLMVKIIMQLPVALPLLFSVPTATYSFVDILFPPLCISGILLRDLF